MATQTRTGRQVMLLVGTGAHIRARLAFYIRCYGPDFRLADLSSGRCSAPIRRAAEIKSGITRGALHAVHGSRIPPQPSVAIVIPEQGIIRLR